MLWCGCRCCFWRPVKIYISIIYKSMIIYIVVILIIVAVRIIRNITAPHFHRSCLVLNGRRRLLAAVRPCNRRQHRRIVAARLRRWRLRARTATGAAVGHRIAIDWHRTDWIAGDPRIAGHRSWTDRRDIGSHRRMLAVAVADRTRGRPRCWRIVAAVRIAGDRNRCSRFGMAAPIRWWLHRRCCRRSLTLDHCRTAAAAGGRALCALLRSLLAMRNSWRQPDRVSCGPAAAADAGARIVRRMARR